MNHEEFRLEGMRIRGLVRGICPEEIQDVVYITYGNEIWSFRAGETYVELYIRSSARILPWRIVVQDRFSHLLKKGVERVSGQGKSASEAWNNLIN